ncbi:MAG TPA: ABC-F family ATP-binding cassette domain-containing protein [Vicinamibacteria bacterium]|nr:ABC-F family ATP-binding cassette domain-containing protein [Vicinamibacteria bacterium]
MIHVESLGKRYGERVLFEDVSWHVKKRDRIGLSGPNGAGKTTLLRMLAGIEEPDSGQIRMASDTTIGYLPQDGVVHSGRTVYEEVVLAFQELLALKAEQHAIEDQLEHANEEQGGHEKALERYAEVTERFKQLGGYEIDARVADVLKGLGFFPADQQRQTEEFSGGWQMRIALAKLLLARPNLLLMDEPTNHLDLPARNWLEEYLAEYPGSVVLVSHDRYFLDATVKRITEVGLKTLTDYHGNYTHYLREHTARMERLREAHRRQSEEIERAEVFINRFRYQATKAKQVQSRIKMLDKVERIEIPPERKKIRFQFPEAKRPGRVVLELKGIRRAYGDNVVLRHVDLMVERGDRIALVGPNGAGKSTLMRILAGVDRPDQGIRLEGHNVVLDYFAQNQAEVLNPARQVVEEMSSASSLTMAPMIRTILGGFLFEGDDVFKKVAVLSGGERNRLALAKMLLKASNVLLLDEPTNHLDLDSKEILLEALEAYGGTLIFVSHDRYFVDKLATRVIEVGGGEAPLYPGGYEDFLYWKKQREAGVTTGLPVMLPPRRGDDEEDGTASVATRAAAPAASAGAVSAPPAAAPAPASASTSSPRPVSNGHGRAKGRSSSSPATTAPSPSPAGANRQPAAKADPLAPRLRPSGTSPERQVLERELRKSKVRLAELEKRITDAEQAVKALEAEMAAPGYYDDRARAAEAAERHQKLMWDTGELMSQWEAVQAEVDEKAGRLAAMMPAARR